MARRAAFVYDDRLSRHMLSETHPMKPVRLRYAYDLLRAYGALDAPNVALLAPQPAERADLLAYHAPEYADAVMRLGAGDASINQARFNFGPGDNPAYEGMYDAAALSTGATLTAVQALLDGEADVAFSISGGLHHAMPAYAYGFCVFNDPVIGIKRLLDAGMRVAYVDIDCHHGDGVQHAFYDTDAVMTVSMHESGAFLFPGTGYVQETGAGRGRGYSVNLPLYPYTSDEVYLWALREAVMPLLERFRPDALVTQLGIDSHYRDPITHLALTAQGHAAAVAELSRLRTPKWLALGGGGYDPQAVARAWTLDFALMSEQTLPDEIPQAYASQHGVTTLRDAYELPIPEQTLQDTRAFAEASAQAIQRLLFPAHGLSG